MDRDVAIRPAEPADEEDWRRLWAAYLAFYGQTLPSDVTDATWRRILDPHSSVFARAAMREGSFVGFAVCVLHEGTWTRAPVCYLEDLFVDPAVRRAGIGRALITDLVEQAGRQGWSRLYWHTEATNAPARRLYDTFAAADGFVRYRIVLDGA